MMTTKEVADVLVTMCRDGKVEETKQELFTEDTVSIEPAEGILPKEAKGLKAIQRKAELFISMVEQFYGHTITDPVVAGDYFSVGWNTDIQMKGQERQTMNQICLYKVKDGKIVSEQFFY
jgi:ketosteroid isomerase-like protein